MSYVIQHLKCHLKCCLVIKTLPSLCFSMADFQRLFIHSILYILFRTKSCVYQCVAENQLFNTFVSSNHQSEKSKKGSLKCKWFENTSAIQRRQMHKWMWKWVTNCQIHSYKINERNKLATKSISWSEWRNWVVVCIVSYIWPHSWNSQMRMT